MIIIFLPSLTYSFKVFVRATSRNPAHAMNLQKMGADVVFFSFEDPRSIQLALEDIDTVCVPVFIACLSFSFLPFFLLSGHADNIIHTKHDKRD